MTIVRSRLVAALVPKVVALATVFGSWQALVWSGWKPQYVLPAPATVFRALSKLATTSVFWSAIATTLRRALVGYGVAVVVGSLIAVTVVRSNWMRSAVGALITGLQTMPSIAWFPLAIVLFKLSEQAIAFVIVLGAAPSIANGVISGVDHIPPLWLRAAHTMDARGVSLWRHVIGPAALPSVIGGLKQGWAFAWRSLMAGELLVVIANRPSLGAKLQFARELSDAPSLLALMIVILILGIAADSAFAAVDLRVRARRGLLITPS